VRSVSTTAIGIAQGALDSYKEVTARRFAASDGAKIADDPHAQSVAAQAASEIDEIKLVLYRNMDEMTALANAGQDIPVERRVQFRYESARAVEKCVHIVDSLFTASGGRAIFLSSPILRYFMDIHAARAHYANNPDKPGRNFGGVQLKLKNTDFFI